MGKNALNVHWHFSHDTLTRSLDVPESSYLNCLEMLIVASLHNDWSCSSTLAVSVLQQQGLEVWALTAKLGTCVMLGGSKARKPVTSIDFKLRFHTPTFIPAVS